jgi:hypothetical protein
MDTLSLVEPVERTVHRRVASDRGSVLVAGGSAAAGSQGGPTRSAGEVIGRR